MNSQELQARNSMGDESRMSSEMPARSKRHMGNRRSTMTMEWFLESNNFNDSMSSMIKRFDTDGNGTFSKDEVLAMISELTSEYHQRDALHLSNKHLRSLLCAVSTLIVFLLIGLFCISYAVAILTAKTTVANDGTLQNTKGVSAPVSVNDHAYVYFVPPNEGGHYCMVPDQAATLQNQVMGGRKVLFNWPSQDGNGPGQWNVAELQIGSAKLLSDGTMCFTKSNTNQQICIHQPTTSVNYCAVEQSLITMGTITAAN